MSVIIEGEKEKVDKLVEFCRKSPEKSLVKRIDVMEENYVGKFVGFERR